MKNKRRIVFILISFLIMTAMYAVPSFKGDPEFNGSIAGMNNWDEGFIEGIILFGDSIGYWFLFIRQFALFFCMINIFYNALKIMLGMEQVKKVFIDIITKVLLFNVCISIYPLAIDRVLTAATNLGINSTNVTGSLAGELTTLYESSYRMAQLGRERLTEMMQSGELKKLDTNAINALSKSFSMSEDEIKDLMEKNGIINPDKKYDKKGKWGARGIILSTAGAAGAGAVGAGAVVAANLGATLLLVSNPVGWITAAAVGGAALFGAIGYGISHAVVKKHNEQLQYGKIKGQKDFVDELKHIMDSKDIQNAMIIFNAFNDVLGKDGVLTEEEMKAIASMPVEQQEKATNELISKRMNQFITTLFLPTESDDAFSTAILAPSSLVRVGIMLAQIVHNEGLYTTEEKTNEEKKGNGDLSIIPRLVGYTVTADLPKLLGLIYRVITPWLLIIPLLLIIAEYIVTILEFYLVTAVGVIFIPLLFLDVTKHYAKNLITLFVNYFFKVLFTTIIVYFCLSNILLTGRKVIFMGEFSLQVIVYVTFQFILCMTLSHAAPRMASALISGQPGVSGGDVMNTMRSMGHGLRTARGAVTSGARTARNAASHLGTGAADSAKIAKTKLQNNAAAKRAVDENYGQKGEGAEKIFANQLKKDGDISQLARYANKQSNGSYFDKDGNISLNEEGKKWAENLRYSEKGQNAIKSYDKGRKEALKAVKKEISKQNRTGLNYGENGAVSANSKNAKFSDNLSQKAKDMKLQDLWENKSIT